MDRNKIVVVLGMHRSGTSAAMRGLEVLGVELGDNLYPPAVDNPKGFWEDRDILDINRELLAHLGSGTECLGLFDWQLPDTPAIASLGRKAETLLRDKCDDTPLWGFKDPRTARLLPFWQPIFASIDRDAHYVIVIRNPVSVVESLRKRNGIAPEKTFYLWLEHLVPALARTGGARRVVVDYDRLLEDPQLQLSRIAKSLELPAPQTSALSVYAKEFLEGGLRHTIFTALDLQRYPSVPQSVVTAYAWLEKLASDAGSLDRQAMERDWEAISREMTALTPALKFVERQDQEILAHIRRAAESEALIASLQAQVANLEAGNAWLTSQRDAWEQATGERERTIAILQAQIKELLAGNAWLNSQRDAWEQAAGERDRAIAQLQAQVQSLLARNV